MANPQRSSRVRSRKRAPNGAGSLYFDRTNNCWVGSVSLGTDQQARRIRRSVRDRDYRKASAKLDELLEEVEAGRDVGNRYTVADAAQDWLEHLASSTLAKGTVEELRCIARKWIVPGLGRTRLKKLTTEDVEVWLQTMTAVLATTSIRKRLGTLRRVIKLAQAHGHVRDNVADLADAPRGTEGRPSKAFTLDQDQAVLRASMGHPIHAYLALTLLTGVRPEEARPLTWRHTHLNPVRGVLCSCGTVHDKDLPAHVEVWHSVRGGGDTKTPKSRRTVALPRYVIATLTKHRTEQRQIRAEHGWKSEDIEYVFGTRYDTPEKAQVIRDQFRAVVVRAGLANEWAPRETRQSFTSILSDLGAPIETIADLLGHASTTTTRTVYRRQLRPVITTGAETLDQVFGTDFLNPE